MWGLESGYDLPFHCQVKFLMLFCLAICRSVSNSTDNIMKYKNIQMMQSLIYVAIKKYHHILTWPVFSNIHMCKNTWHILLRWHVKGFLGQGVGNWWINVAGGDGSGYDMISCWSSLWLLVPWRGPKPSAATIYNPKHMNCSCNYSTLSIQNKFLMQMCQSFQSQRDGKGLILY